MVPCYFAYVLVMLSSDGEVKRSEPVKLSNLSNPHLLIMQTLITLQTIQNYNAIRNWKDEFIVYLGL